MVAIKLPTFAGMVPSIDPHLLGDQHASYARNSWLYSGALVGLPEMVPIHTMANPNARIAFRIPINDGDPTYLYNSTWLEFENELTDFISAPVAADQYKRYYWTSTSSAPRYNTRDRIEAGLPPWLLGLPQPDNLIVNATGGSSGTVVSRAYIATLVTEYGEEGPASNPQVISGKVDATFEVTLPAVPASDRGVDRNIKKIRLYRTIVSASGSVTYYLVTEVNATGATQVYNDTSGDNVIATKPILESTAWTAPPDLDGFAVMPNGIIAGYKNNELYFSEAYRPHAWPVAYALMLEFDIVGIAVVNQTLVVCTKGNPYTASGVNPASITTSMLGAFEPCLSKGSILPTEDGVYYTSSNGLMLVNAGFAQNITRQYISRDKWNEIANNGKVNAGRFGSAYYAFGAGVPKTFDEPAWQGDMIQIEDMLGFSHGFLVDPSNANVGYVPLLDQSSIMTVANDALSGELLVFKDGQVLWLDQQPGFKCAPYVWRSKIFQTPDLRNFAAFKLHFYEPEGFAPTAPINTNLVQEFDPLNQMAIVRVYADGRLVLAHEVRKSGELHRVPSGFKAEYWEVEIEAIVKVKSFQMATSVKELSRV